MAQQEEVFSLQTAGHQGSFRKQGAVLLKPASAREAAFYQEHYQRIADLRQFVPRYHGREHRDEKIYLLMEDLTHGFRKPCILDVKMGTDTAGEDAAPAKRSLMRQKDLATTTATLGLRICGMRVFRGGEQGYLVRDKDWGKAVTQEGFEAALREFFVAGEGERATLRRGCIVQCVECLRPLLAFFEHQAELRFYSSSLLFLYEGEPEAERDAARPAVVKMIDFAHVHPITDPQARDEGYLFGLRNLIDTLTALLEHG